MNTIEAIEAHYAGCRFRSRREARWAVFFDTLGIPWEYEPEGFVLSSGRYLPDFYLPTIRRWVEVRGKLPNDNEMMRYFDFAQQQWTADGATFTMLVGSIPRRTAGLGFTRTALGVPGGPFGLRTLVYSRPAEKCDPSSWVLIDIDNDGKARDFVAHDPSNGAFFRALWLINGREACLPGGTVDQALTAARSARFEHGENGK